MNTEDTDAHTQKNAQDNKKRAASFQAPKEKEIKKDNSSAEAPKKKKKMAKLSVDIEKLKAKS